MKIAITGAGCTGMSAAILLARLGHEVHVFEKSAQAAPLLRGFNRDGLHFETGFHFGGGLHEGGVLRRWFRVLGIDAALPSLPLHEDDGNTFLFADKSRFALPYGGENLLRMAAERFPGHVAEVEKLLDDLRAVLARSPYTNPACSGTAPSMGFGDAGGLLRHLSPLPPVLQRVLRTFCLLYGVPPEEALWKDFCMVAGCYLQSSHALRGGGEAVAAALEQEARRGGVSFSFGQAVAGFTTQPDPAGRRGFRLDGIDLDSGEHADCDACIYTGHPADLPSLVPAGTFRPAYARCLGQLTESAAPFIVFGMTRSSVLDGRNLFLMDTPIAFLHDGIRLENAVYLSAGPADACGRRPVTAVTPARSFSDCTGNAYRQAKKGAAEQLAGVIRGACPELADFTVLDAATDVTFRHWIHGSRGGIYGVCHSRDAAPLLPVTHLSGLFLAGQHILLPGLLGCIVSAAVAAGCIAGHDRIFKEFRTCGSESS